MNGISRIQTVDGIQNEDFPLFALRSAPTLTLPDARELTRGALRLLLEAGSDCPTSWAARRRETGLAGSTIGSCSVGACPGSGSGLKFTSSSASSSFTPWLISLMSSSSSSSSTSLSLVSGSMLSDGNVMCGTLWAAPPSGGLACIKPVGVRCTVRTLLWIKQTNHHWFDSNT